jgi:hypothetical protein
MEEKLPSNDHDLLITLNVRVQDLIDTIKAMDGTLSREIGGLKASKVDKDIYAAHCAETDKNVETINKEFATIWKKSDEHSADIKNLTKYLWLGMGALAIIQFLAPFIISRVF